MEKLVKYLGRTKALNLSGLKFGRLNVIGLSGVDRHGNRTWGCICDCGKEKVIAGSLLKRGIIKSCGCFAKEKARDSSITHGKSRTRTYSIWLNMLARCNNKNNPRYKDYGGRGIKVCDQWRKFEIFYSDMKDAPEGTTIDRKDNDGDYCPNNCRWVDAKNQSRNKRSNRMITFNGITKCAVEWAEELGVNPNTLRNRLHSGWTADRALTEGVR